jgi:hypothetical protein
MRNPWKDESLKMDQNIEDIDPDARKKYDRDMKAYAKAMKNSPEGDVSLEKKYPDAKITKVPPNAPPERPKNLETPRSALAQDAMAEYERKAEKFEKANEKSSSRGGGSGVLPLDKMLKMNKMNYKAGGKVSSASKRGDGIAQRGKTRGKIV